MVISTRVVHPKGALSPTLKTDFIDIEWYEASKRVQRKTTRAGVEFGIRLDAESERLQDGDIIFLDDVSVVRIAIKPCEAIVIAPKTMDEMARACYELGNKHMPLFLQDGKLLMPFEQPMFEWLRTAGYKPEKASAQLVQQMRAHSGGGGGHSHGHDHDHGHSHGGHTHTHADGTTHTH